MYCMDVSKQNEDRNSIKYTNIPIFMVMTMVSVFVIFGPERETDLPRDKIFLACSMFYIRQIPAFFVTTILPYARVLDFVCF